MHRGLDYLEEQERKIVNLFRKTILVIIGSIFIGMAAAPFANGEALGRLFFTPEQRTQLDHHNYRPTAAITDTAAATETPANEQSLTVNGIVQRNGGKRTAWINGAARTVGQSDDNASVMVNIPDQNKIVKLKVGQRILLSPPANTNATKPGTEKPAPANDD